MSYDIGLYKDEDLVEVPPFTEGGTYPIGGRTLAELNITYNYSWFFERCLDEERGLRWLYGKKAITTIVRLQQAIDELGTDQFENYWAPTPGNAGHALNILLRWARQHPNAIWQGD